MTPHDVLLRPVLTEKTQAGLLGMEEGVEPKYAFYVHPKATRSQVKDAVEKIFTVKVTKLNVINVRGKERSVGRFKGLRPKRKKVIVTLRPGQRIRQLEGLS